MAGIGISSIFRPARRQRPSTIAAIGWGGQRLHIVPSRNLVVVINAGNYQQPVREQARIAATVMSGVMLPSLHREG